MASLFRRRGEHAHLPPPPQPVAKGLSSADARREVGVAGLKQRSGLILEEFDRNLQGAKAFKVWREMPDSDPIAGAVWFLLRMYLQAAEWTVQPFEQGVPEYEADAVFLQSCMDDLPVPWSAITDDVWTCLQFGWSWLEPVYKPRHGATDDEMTSSRFTDGAWGWSQLAFRAQDSWRRWQFDPDTGRLEGWWQDTGNGSEVLLTRAKGLHFRTTRARGNPEGRSIFRSAYTPWWFRKRLREIEAIGIERDLNGLPVVYVSPEVLEDSANADVLAAYESLVKDVRADEQAGVVLPSVYDEHGNQLVRLELLSSGGQKATDPGAVIARYGTEIAVSVLADVILLGHQATGSYALSITKDAMLQRTMEAWLSDAADVFNREEIPRLFALNGNRTGNLPRLVATAPDGLTVEQILSALKNLADTGAPLWPSAELGQWVEQRTGIPVPDFDEFTGDGTMPAGGGDGSPVPE